MTTYDYIRLQIYSIIFQKNVFSIKGDTRFNHYHIDYK